jgi:hypothetical protein
MMKTPTLRSRAEIGNIKWPREELLQIAWLLDRLEPPDHRSPERYFLQRQALGNELRRLAGWAPGARKAGCRARARKT